MKAILSILLLVGEEALSSLEGKKKSLWQSSLVLIIVNAIPLLGIALLGWEPRMILLIYWAESAIIGILNIAKMALAGWSGGVLTFLGSIFFIAFFLVHYGMFMGVHGLFLLVLLFVKTGADGSINDSEIIPALEKIISEFSINSVSGFLHSEWISLILIFISHLYAFQYYTLRKKEYLHHSVPELLFSPYTRIMVMHLVILGGVTVMTLKGEDISTLIYALVLLKTLADLWSHVREVLKIKIGQENWVS